MTLAQPPSPQSLAELIDRARALEGRALGELATSHGFTLGEHGAQRGTHTKGKPGALIETILGATGGPSARHDFPELLVELKTLPLDARRLPLESTYVCRVPAGDADRVEWSSSWARAKLSQVLFVPILAETRAQPFADRLVGRSVLWRPSLAEEAALRADFEDIMGQIALGGVETLTAHVGRVMQCRPKAANGSVRMSLRGPDGEAIATVPRGFYLRPAFTASILRGAS